MRAMRAALLVAIAIGCAVAAVAAGTEQLVPRLVGRTRADADRVLRARGLSAGTPGAATARFAPIETGVDSGLIEMARDADLRRRVTAQAVFPGVRISRGSFVGLATRSLPGHVAGPVAFFGPGIDTHVRYAIAADDRTLTLGFRPPFACSAFDHVDVAGFPHAVLASPAVVTSEGRRARCQRPGTYAARLRLSRPLRGRVPVAFPPSAPGDRLFRVTAGHWAPAPAPALRSSRAIALAFAHSSGCGYLAGTTVRESSRSVAISMLVGDSFPSAVCPADLRGDEAVVALRHPLGHRRIERARLPLGQVTGSIVLAGGPAPGHQSDRNPGAVRLVDAAGNVVAARAVRRGESYELTAPEGTYTLAGTSTLAGRSGDLPCLSQRVIVSAQSPARADTTCSIA